MLNKQMVFEFTQVVSVATGLSSWYLKLECMLLFKDKMEPWLYV